MALGTSGGEVGRRVRSALAAFAFLAVFAASATFTLTRMVVPGDPTSTRYGMQDFRDAIYFPTVAFLEGHNPYDSRDFLRRYPVGLPFPLYSPHTLLLHAPLGLLSQEHAQWAFLLVNGLASIGLAALALAAAGVPRTGTSVLALAALVLASRPGQTTLFIGQGSLIMTIGAYLALAGPPGRTWLAAAGLAVACVKPTFGVPIAILLLCRREVGLVGRAALLAGISSGLVLAVLASGTGGPQALLASTIDNLGVFAARQSARSSIAVMRLDLHHLFARLTGSTLSTVGNLALTCATLAAAGLGVRRLSADRSAESAALTTTLICVTALVAIYHQAYDAVLLVLPTILVTRSIWPGPERGVPRWTRSALLVCLVVPLVNYLAAYSVIAIAPGIVKVLLLTTNAMALAAGFTILLFSSLRFRGAAHD